MTTKTVSSPNVSVNVVGTNPTSTTPTTREIVIMQRGWIIVGDVRKDGDQYVITDSSVIRRWGTDKGIGQLALGGPTKDTILDPCGTVFVHELAVVGRILVHKDGKGRDLI